MILRTLQWNIGGGKIRLPDGDPEKMSSYTEDGLAYITEKIAAFEADIVTLQETHASDKHVQAKEIAEKLSFNWTNDVYDISHINADFGLGQAILSRFSFKNHYFSLFHNPKLEAIEEETGQKWISHDKGISSAQLLLSNGEELSVQTLHSVPIRRFNYQPSDERVKPLIQDIDSKIDSKASRLLLQGDFNLNMVFLKELFPQTFENGVAEVPCDRPTTPKDRRYDHVFYKGLKLVKIEVVDDVLTDHYPIYCEFEL